MKRKRNIFNSDHIGLTIDRLCHEVIENHSNLKKTAILGLQPRGIFFAERIHKRLEHFSKDKIDVGQLDITFFRDDFRRRDHPLSANPTKLNFDIEDRRIILVDDVLFTGRTIRAALSAINTYGRAQDIELLVMIDRSDARELPIQPNYIGQQVSIVNSQKVVVQLKEEGFNQDSIHIVNKDI